MWTGAFKVDGFLNSMTMKWTASRAFDGGVHENRAIHKDY